MILNGENSLFFARTLTLNFGKLLGSGESNVY